MDQRTQELISRSVAERREVALTYLAGLDGAELYPMGKGAGVMITDEYGAPHLDFGDGGALLVMGHLNEGAQIRMLTQLGNGVYRAPSGQFLDHFPTAYARALSDRFPARGGSAPYQVLFLASSYEARLVAAQICVNADDSGGAHFLGLLDSYGAPREGGEVQDEVHRSKAKGFKIVADETFTGFGRTGRFCFYEHYGLTPDVVLLGPAAGAGLPFAAVIAPRELFEVPAFTTIQAMVRSVPNTLACAGGSAILDQLTDEIYEHVQTVGEILKMELRSICEQFTHVVSTAVGVGFLWSLQLRHPSRAAEFRHYCRKAGLIISPDMRLTPPLVATEEQVRMAADALASACIEMGEEEEEQ